MWTYVGHGGSHSSVRNIRRDSHPSKKFATMLKAYGAVLVDHKEESLLFPPERYELELWEKKLKREWTLEESLGAYKAALHSRALKETVGYFDQVLGGLLGQGTIYDVQEYRYSRTATVNFKMRSPKLGVLRVEITALT